MKAGVWIAFALLALLWTGLTGVSALLVEGSAALLASADASAIGAAVQTNGLPAWLAPWLGEAQWAALVEAAAASLGGLQSALPWFGAALGWLVPVIWVVWGIGLLLMLILALVGARLVGGFGRRVAAA